MYKYVLIDQTRIFIICQVILFTLNISVINQCNNPQYIQMIYDSWIFTEGNQYFSHLFIFYLK